MLRALIAQQLAETLGPPARPAGLDGGHARVQPRHGHDISCDELYQVLIVTHHK